jgi:anti-sigma-K factor RskA
VTGGANGVQETAVRYVLGEMDAAETRAVEARLATDAALAAEVRRLRGALGLLPLATATEPPPGLRERIVAAAEERAPARRPAPVLPLRREARREPRRLVWSRFAAAAAAALALAFGLDAARTRRELALQRELASTLHEPNVVRTFTLAGTGAAGGAYGTVALDLDAKRGAVVVKGLETLPAGKVYRLWAQVAQRAVPCGDFAARPDGGITAQFAVPVETYTAPLGELFVTVEPEPPPPAPTGPRVLESV